MLCNKFQLKKKKLAPPVYQNSVPFNQHIPNRSLWLPPFYSLLSSYSSSPSHPHIGRGYSKELVGKENNKSKKEVEMQKRSKRKNKRGRKARKEGENDREGTEMYQ